jgi:DnaK suppressor protein
MKGISMSKEKVIPKEKTETDKYAKIRKDVIFKRNEAKTRLNDYKTQLRDESQKTSLAPGHQASEIDSGNNVDLMIKRFAWQLKRYNQVIAKIDDGTYGPCADCGEEIPIKRLQAYPLTFRCINCAELDQKNNGIYH